MNTLSLRLPILVRFPLVAIEKTASRVFVFAAFSIVLMLLGLYLFQVGDLIRNSYLNENYKMQVEKISEQNLALETNSSDLLSFDRIERKAEELGFVKVSEIKYLPIPFHFLTRKNP